MKKIVIIFIVLFARINSANAEVFYDSTSVFSIHPLPSPQISGKTTVDENTSETYTSAASDGNSWSVDGGVIVGDDSGEEVEIRWGASGDGEIKLIVENEFGCADSTTIDVEIEDSGNPPDSDIAFECEDFGEYPVDADLKMRGSVLLKNLTARPIEIKSVESSSGEFTVVGFPDIINSNSSEEVLIDFKPAQLSLRQGILTATSDVGTAECDLIGTGIELSDDAEKVGIELSISPTEAAPGDTVQLYLKILNHELLPSSATKYTTKIYLNPRVLLAPKTFTFFRPEYNNSVGQIRNGLQIVGERIPGEEVLIEIDLEVLLGDEDTTAILFKENPEWLNSSVPVYTVLKDSIFIVDICRAGGERLLKLKTDESYISQIMPNPIDESATIAWRVGGKSSATLSLASAFGEEIELVKREYSGKIDDYVAIDTRDFPSGVYLLVLKVDGRIVDKEKVLIVK